MARRSNPRSIKMAEQKNRMISKAACGRFEIIRFFYLMEDNRFIAFYDNPVF